MWGMIPFLWSQIHAKLNYVLFRTCICEVAHKEKQWWDKPRMLSVPQGNGRGNAHKQKWRCVFSHPSLVSWALLSGLALGKVKWGINSCRNLRRWPKHSSVKIKYFGSGILTEQKDPLETKEPTFIQVLIWPCLTWSSLIPALVWIKLY